MLRFARTVLLLTLLVWAMSSHVLAQNQSTEKPRPHVVVVGVNGMEMDVIRPLILQGKMPNLAHVIKKGSYGKLRTVSAPNCPRVYSTRLPARRPRSTG